MIFQEVREAGLKLKLSKCAFSRDICKKKLKMILELAPPRDVTETRNIIVLTSYCKKFVKNFSDIVKTLTELKARMQFPIGVLSSTKFGYYQSGTDE